MARERGDGLSRLSSLAVLPSAQRRCWFGLGCLELLHRCLGPRKDSRSVTWAGRQLQVSLDHMWYLSSGADGQGLCLTTDCRSWLSFVLNLYTHKGALSPSDPLVPARLWAHAMISLSVGILRLHFSSSVAYFFTLCGNVITFEISSLQCKIWLKFSQWIQKLLCRDNLKTQGDSYTAMWTNPQSIWV